VRKIIGDKIRKLRKSKGLKQANLAHDMNVSPGVISKIERGEYNTSMKHFEGLSESLEVNIIDFFMDIEPANIVKDPPGRYGIDYVIKEIQAMKEESSSFKEEMKDIKVILNTIVSLLAAKK